MRSLESQILSTPATACGDAVTKPSTAHSTSATSSCLGCVAFLWLSSGVVSSLPSPAITSGVSHPTSSAAKSTCFLSEKCSSPSWKLSVDHAVRLLA